MKQNLTSTNGTAASALAFGSFTGDRRDDLITATKAACTGAGPTPIISARSAEQLAPSIAALDNTMPPDVHDAIAGLSPAPPPATDRIEEQQ